MTKSKTSNKSYKKTTKNNNTRNNTKNNTKKTNVMQCKKSKKMALNQIKDIIKKRIKFIIKQHKEQKGGFQKGPKPGNVGLGAETEAWNALFKSISDFFSKIWNFLTSPFQSSSKTEKQEQTQPDLKHADSSDAKSVEAIKNVVIQSNLNTPELITQIETFKEEIIGGLENTNSQNERQTKTRTNKKKQPKPTRKETKREKYFKKEKARQRVLNGKLTNNNFYKTFNKN